MKYYTSEGKGLYYIYVKELSFEYNGSDPGGVAKTAVTALAVSLLNPIKLHSPARLSNYHKDEQ